MEKKWKIEYYLYNLTEMETKTFFTEVGAYLYALFVSRHYGFRTYVKEI